MSQKQIRRSVKSANISRRTLLRGAGAALALPWLEAMVSTASAARGPTVPPTRLAVLFMPNGVRADNWTPEGKGRDFLLSPQLQPLEALKDELVVLTNLWNQASDFGDGHYVKTSGLLTCTTITKSLGVDLNCNGVSMDQVAAAAVAGRTPIRSLELAMDPVNIGVDGAVGYTRVYGAHIAWAGPQQPLARDIDPQVVYRRLFRATQSKGTDHARDTRLLDRVLADAKMLRQRLGVADRDRVDDYLESVRALEQQLSVIKGHNRNWQPRAKIDERPVHHEEQRSSHPQRVKLMLDMLALAFQADVTRVSTLMFGNAVSPTDFSFLEGVKGGHHEMSHHERRKEKLRQYEAIAHWHITQYAYLLDRLRKMREGEGSVLDHSMIMFGSGLRDGNSHSPRNLPILLAGRAGGRFATGQHLVFRKNTPLANLYTSMLDAFGAGTGNFADADGPLEGLSA